MTQPNQYEDKELRDELNKLIEKSPIDKEVPDDIWGTIYATWTGLWTDGYGEWDEKQPSDIYPLDELLSTQAKDRFVNELLQLITQKQLEARIAEANNYIYVSFSVKEGDKTSEKIVPIRFMEYRIKELQAELTKQEEKC